MVLAGVAALCLTLAVEAAPAPESTSEEPVLPFKTFLLDSGRTLASPFLHPRPRDVLVVGAAAVLVTAALIWDAPLSRNAREHWPDPRIGTRRLSYYGSFLGEGYVDVAFFAGLGLLSPGRGRATARAGLEALLVTAVVSEALKVSVRRERPTDVASPNHWGGALSASSFPSGHAMSAFASAAVLADAYPRLAPLFYTLASYVGVTRLEQGAHWASDVVVGSALGLLFGWAAAGLNDHARVMPSLQGQAPGLCLQGGF